MHEYRIEYVIEPVSKTGCAAATMKYAVRREGDVVAAGSSVAVTASSNRLL